MTQHIDEFAERLRQLKERSGRSYGMLATRLHTSTSTLHRYCNGAAVPGEYAPVERFARQCGASAEELVELHQRWLLADAAKRREPQRAQEAKPDQLVAVNEEFADPAPGAVPPGQLPSEDAPPAPAEVLDVADVPPPPPAARRPRLRVRRTTLAMAAAAALTTVLTLVPRPGHGADDAGAAARIPSTAAPNRPATTAAPPTHPPSSASASGRTHGPATTATSAAPSVTVRPVTGGKPPLQVTVLADNWDTWCGQWFLIKQPPQNVPPPPTLERANAWAAALGGVPAGHLRLQLTAQGLPGQPVVLHTLYVTVTGRTAARKGNLYSGEDGCGGGLDPASFDVDLDAADPGAVAVPGPPDHRTNGATRHFPFQISANDPEVLDVDGHTLDHDVSWYMDLSWTCGDREGTLRIDDHGAPFRTIGTRGDPRYNWALTRWTSSPPDSQ